MAKHYRGNCFITLAPGCMVEFQRFLTFHQRGRERCRIVI